MKSKDLTGQKFGLLTAEKEIKKENGAKYWFCRCDCGNTKMIRQDSLTSGRTKSCGCLGRNRQTTRTESIVGNKYGRLTAIAPTEQHSTSEGRMWKWECDCGRTVILPLQRVKQGRTKSCGCLSRITADQQRADITGQKFGRLTAIGPTQNRSRGEVVWEFQCDCGNRIQRPQNLVSSGKCSSCGCLGRENQQNVYENTYKRNHVLGTNLAALRQSEDQLPNDNKSGIKGVYFDTAKHHYVACIGFQGEYLRVPCTTKEEAILVRSELKQLHNDFIAWWDSLSEAEKTKITNLYDSEKQAYIASFRARIKIWEETNPVFRLRR